MTEKPRFDEVEFQRSNPQYKVEELVVELAYGKAQSIARVVPRDFVIGSDQMVVCDGKIYGKGHDAEGTARNLRELSGQTHFLLTSLVVMSNGQTFRHLEKMEMRMRPLTEEQIHDYILCDQPFDCAGGYKFEKAGISLMESVHGRDPSSILGLPLLELTRILIDCGLGFPFQKF